MLRQRKYNKDVPMVSSEQPLTVRLCKQRLTPEDFVRRMEAQA
ncbi:hypothetical protein [Frisingicoccus sp.]